MNSLHAGLLLNVFLITTIFSAHVLCLENEEEKIIEHFQIATFHFDEVRAPLLIVIWILVASTAKIGFNLLRPITKNIPDSALLILVGLSIGVILKSFGASLGIYTLDSHVFFIYILPPIIFDAGYFMPKCILFENFNSVLLFSIVGTLFNTFAIVTFTSCLLSVELSLSFLAVKFGISLFWLSGFRLFSVQFSLFEVLVFSSLISAVDPVAVIAVFEEIHVNDFLFINVFGEALFNDGVTVVLYQMFKAFAHIGAANLIASDYIAGAGSFVFIALGGALLGILFAFLTAFLTRYTNSIRILAPVIIFIMPYAAYLCAEMVSLSPIIAIAACGMLMKQYVKGNITPSADTSVKYFAKMLSQATEMVVFVFLGLATISSEHKWDTLFVVFTILLCLLFRTIGVVIQCFFLNLFRSKKFSKVDQFILSYGGLRGAIAFGLAASMPASIVAKSMFVTTTIAVIYFTVFLQGITIKPLVKWLSVETTEHRTKTLAESAFGNDIDHVMSGLEVIAGIKGHNTVRTFFERINARFLRPLLVRDHIKAEFDNTKVVRAYAKLTLQEALNSSVEADSFLKTSVSDETKTASVESIDRDEIEIHELPGRLGMRRMTLAELLTEHGNVDVLLNKFSEILDKKLTELNLQQKDGLSNDIPDDYIHQILQRNVSHAGDEDVVTVGKNSDRPSSERKADPKRRNTMHNVARAAKKKMSVYF